MKSLFNEVEYKEIRNRIENLKPDNAKQWGKMTIAQMMAHCSAGIELALGKTPFVDKSNFIMRTLVKKIVINAVKKGDLGKNQKTFPEFVVNEDKEFDKEKSRLLENLDSFYKFGQQNEIGRHPYFGKFSKENWGALQYVHSDHHLTQFSA